jgi:hypothetical protein
VCPIGTDEGKHRTRGGFSVGQGKIGGRRGAEPTRRTGEEEGKGRGGGSAWIYHAEEEGVGVGRGPVVGENVAGRVPTVRRRGAGGGGSGCVGRPREKEDDRAQKE